MPEIRLADCSEFQSSIDAPAYLAAGHTTLIVRAHNGYRPDKLWRERRDYLRRFPFAALGFYQYIAADRDPAEQAHDFIAAVGPLRANEFPVGDLEEGKGSQIGPRRAVAAHHRPMVRLPRHPVLRRGVLRRAPRRHRTLEGQAQMGRRLPRDRAHRAARAVAEHRPGAVPRHPRRLRRQPLPRHRRAVRAHLLRARGGHAAGRHAVSRCRRDARRPPGDLRRAHLRRDPAPLER